MAYINPVNQSFCLQMLCESNFQRLQRMLPPLHREFKRTWINGRGQTGMAVQELDRTPYTLTLQLNPTDDRTLPVDPTIRVRVYLDTRAVEVLETGNPLNHEQERAQVCPYERMQQKWALNYFLEKWLHFLSAPTPQDQPEIKPELSEL